MSFAVQERIDSDTSEIWRHLTDPELMARWMPGIDNWKTRDNRPLHANSELLFTARGAERTSNVIEFRTEQVLTLRSTQGPITATYRYSLRPDGGATLVSLDAKCVASGIARVIAPAIGFLMRRADSGQLKALNQAVTHKAD